MKRRCGFAEGDAELVDTFKSCTRRMERMEGTRETFLCGTGWGGQPAHVCGVIGQQLTAFVEFGHSPRSSSLEDIEDKRKRRGRIL